MHNNSTEWIGKRYGKLVVIGLTKATPPYRGWRWICKCDCGNTKVYDPPRLKSGRGVSCGCSVGHARKHGGTGTRLYHVWDGMKQRCNNPNSEEYHRYGGRGITICEEWGSFANFRDWAMSTGYDPDAPQGECTLDRIDNDGNYEPSNCRWVDMQEQMQNRPRRSPSIAYNNESHTLYEWAQIMGVSYQKLRNYRAKGWSIEKIMSICRNTGATTTPQDVVFPLDYATTYGINPVLGLDKMNIV